MRAERRPEQRALPRLYLSWVLAISGVTRTPKGRRAGVLLGGAALLALIYANGVVATSHWGRCPPPGSLYLAIRPALLPAGVFLITGSVARLVMDDLYRRALWDRFGYADKLLTAAVPALIVGLPLAGFTAWHSGLAADACAALPSLGLGSTASIILAPFAALLAVPAADAAKGGGGPWPQRLDFAARGKRDRRAAARRVPDASPHDGARRWRAAWTAQASAGLANRGRSAVALIAAAVLVILAFAAASEGEDRAAVSLFAIAAVALGDVLLAPPLLLDARLRAAGVSFGAASLALIAPILLVMVGLAALGTVFFGVGSADLVIWLLASAVAASRYYGRLAFEGSPATTYRVAATALAAFYATYLLIDIYAALLIPAAPIILYRAARARAVLE